MSGIVNQEVAEKAHDVKADELLRKPFHPQDLVARVKKLLHRDVSAEKSAPTENAPVNPLSQLFGFPVPASVARPAPSSVPAPLQRATAPPTFPAVALPAPRSASPVSTPSTNSAEIAKLRSEIQHLSSLVKKLQAQLEVEREYCTALESQLRTLSAVE